MIYLILTCASLFFWWLHKVDPCAQVAWVALGLRAIVTTLWWLAGEFRSLFQQRFPEQLRRARLEVRI